jgi:hypothetical protein
MRHSAESIFIVEYLHEFESICKTVLAHESGDPGVQFNEKKTEGRKFCETVPLISTSPVTKCLRNKTYFCIVFDRLFLK